MSNVVNTNITLVEWDAVDGLPPHIRHLIMCEATTCPNPVNVVEYRCHTYPPIPWEEVLRGLQNFSREEHRADFNGVHPSIDTPRAVW